MFASTYTYFYKNSSKSNFCGNSGNNGFPPDKIGGNTFETEWQRWQQSLHWKVTYVNFWQIFGVLLGFEHHASGIHAGTHAHHLVEVPALRLDQSLRICPCQKRRRVESCVLHDLVEGLADDHNLILVEPAVHLARLVLAVADEAA